MLDEPLFICNTELQSLVSTFVTSLGNLAQESKLELGLKLIKTGTTIKEQLERVPSTLNKRRQSFSPSLIMIKNLQLTLKTKRIKTKIQFLTSIQFLSTQKNKLFELQQNFERYVNTLRVFVFNSAKYKLNLINSYRIPLLVNEKEIEPTVIKKANQFVSFKIGNVQFLGIMSFLGSATSLESVLKAYRTSETKSFLPYESFDSIDKLIDQPLPPYDDFFSRLRNSDPFEQTHSEYQNFIESGCNSEAAKKNSSLQKFFPTGTTTMLIYSKYGALKTCNHSVNIFEGSITKM